MDIFSELQTALLSDLNVSTSSSLFPTATIKLALNRAYIKAGRLFRWPVLSDAKKTGSVEDREYYEAPENWSPNSIWRLEMDGNQYGEDPDGSPMAYEDYLIWRADEDNDNSTEKKWSQQGKRYFIYPVPTSDGNNNISIWGQKNAAQLVSDGDTTIFSYEMPDGNEAIVLEAKAILKHKGEDNKGGQFFSADAKAMLAVAWNKLQQEKAKFEKVQPFFYVEDMFSGKSTVESVIGNF